MVKNNPWFSLDRRTAGGRAMSSWRDGQTLGVHGTSTGSLESAPTATCTPSGSPGRSGSHQRWDWPLYIKQGVPFMWTWGWVPIIYFIHSALIPISIRETGETQTNPGHEQMGHSVLYYCVQSLFSKIGQQ